VTHQLLWREQYSPVQLVGRLHPLDKISGQINGGHILLVPGGNEAECWADLAQVVVGGTATTWWKQNIPPSWSTGSEQKLRNFHKAQIIAPKPALWVVGADDCSHTSSLWYHLRKLICIRQSIPPRKAWNQTPWAHPLQSCSIRRGNTHCHTAHHTSLKKRQRHKERLCQKC
jgi:hypothetical protein